LLTNAVHNLVDRLRHRGQSPKWRRESSHGRDATRFQHSYGDGDVVWGIADNEASRSYADGAVTALGRDAAGRRGKPRLYREKRGFLAALGMTWRVLESET